MEINLSWLITELIQSLEIKASVLFDLDFANNNILSCFAFFFLIIGLCILIPAINENKFNPIAELVVPINIGIPIKEAKAEIEIWPVVVEAKIKEVFSMI